MKNNFEPVINGSRALLETNYLTNDQENKKTHNINASAVLEYNPITKQRKVVQTTNLMANKLGNVKNYQPGFAGKANNLEILPNPDDSKNSSTIITPEFVFSPDGRTRVADPAAWPSSAIGRVRMHFSDGSEATASGILVNPFQVLTAGHVVFEATDAKRGWVSNIEFIPGSKGSIVAYGNTNRADNEYYGEANATYFRTYTGWTNGDFNYDLGLITLDRNIGNYTGWFGYGYDNGISNGTWFNVGGYPADLFDSDGNGFWDNYDQVTQSGTITETTDLTLRSTNLDIMGGNSGGPLWKDNQITYGVVSNETSWSSGYQYNEFTRITGSRFSDIGNWINEDKSARSPIDRPDLVDYDQWFNKNFAYYSPGFITPGNNFTARSVVRNNGTAAAGNFNVSFYASTNNIISTVDYFIGNVNISSLNSFNWSDAIWTGAFPNIPQGNYYLGWLIDSGNTQAEFDEFNNSNYISGLKVLPPPSISINDVSITEGNSSSKTIFFQVNLSAANDSWISVNYSTSNGTASSSTDYLATSGTVFFAPGDTLETIGVTVLADSLVESNQTFNLNLNSPSGANISDFLGVGTIINDDVALPAISISDVTLSEGNSLTLPANFALKLSKANATPVTVKFATSNGTATFPSDYAATTGTVTFSGGQTLKTITAKVVGDLVFEPNETFNLNLSGATGATISDALGVGTIINDDLPLPSLTINDVTLTEGNSGTFPANFAVKLSKTSTTPVTVKFASANGTATAPGDYATTTGSITFSAGQTLKTITAKVVGDTLIEANETFNLNLITPTGATISDGLGVATIINDDLPKLSVSDVTLFEGNSGTKTANFVVKLSAASPTPVTAKFASANGTATTPSDYAATTGTLTFSAGQTLKTITANVVGDLVFEPNETFNLNLSGPVGATISDATGVATILNDDLPKLSISDVTLFEGNSGTKTANFVVKLSAASPTPVTAKFASANGTATTPSDYAATTGTLTFSAGQTLKTITANVVGDLVFEPNETFNLNLSLPVGATISDGLGVANIINDDDASKLKAQSDFLVGQIKTLHGTLDSDVFVLGTQNQPYYGTNADQDYAFIVDFDPIKDTIQLHGKADDYRFLTSDQGTKILHNNFELIAIVQNVSQIHSANFVFV